MDENPLSVESIFYEALQRTSRAQREAYLADACGSDAELLGRVEKLLAASSRAADFMESSPTGLEVTAASSGITERPGTVIGDYKLLEQIGEGGMGIVFVAERSKPYRQKVALKVIKPGMDSKSVIARFQAEQQALALMDHPNIARVLDAGMTEHGRPYFVMELVRGLKITDYCDRHRLTIRERLELFAQVCQAAQHAHQKAIIHRDIKPSNVLVTEKDGQAIPKVIDFGIAKALNQGSLGQSVYTQFKQVMGTPLYMSPEQTGESAVDVDTRSDVYSLGVLLYELLTGTTPFTEQELKKAGDAEMLRIIRETVPPKPSTKINTLGAQAPTVSASRRMEYSKLGQAVHGDLDWIVMKALEKERARRYESASAFAADVQRYLSDDAIEARPPSTVYRLRKTASRHRVALATTAAVMMALLAGATVSTWQWFEAVADRKVAVAAQRDAVTARQDADRERDKAETALAFVRDYTVLLAMSGDLEDLGKAIQIADVAGEPQVWRQMLEARSAMHRGDLETAITLLEQGVQESPANLACKGMLLSVQAWTGCSDGMGIKLRDFRQELLSRDSLSFEEMLFGGEAMLLESDEGIQWMDRALQVRDSNLARLIRSAMLARHAIEFNDTNRIEEALRDVKLALRGFPNSPFVVGENLKVHTLAMQVLRNQNQSYESLRDDAEKALKFLQRFPDYKAGKLWRAWYLDNFGDRSEADSAWFDVLESGCEGWHKAHAAVVFIGRRTKTDASTFFQGSDTLEQFGLIAALYHQGHEVEARSVYEKQPRDDKRLGFVFGTHLDQLLVIGPVTEVRDEAKRLLTDHNLIFTTEFDRYLTKFLAGEAIFTDVIYQCTNNSDRSMAHFAAARLRIHENSWGEAKEHLEKTVELGVVHIGDYYWAKAYLRKYADQFEEAGQLQHRG